MIKGMSRKVFFSIMTGILMAVAVYSASVGAAGIVPGDALRVILSTIPVIG